MKIIRLTLITGWLAAALVSGCSSEAPIDPSANQSIALCKQVMQQHSGRMQHDSHKTEKLQHQCDQTAQTKTPAQWQCVLDGLNKGGEYIPVSSQCFGLK